MKYIKQLNIDFNNWDEANEFNIGDKVIATRSQLFLCDDNLSRYWFNLSCSNIRNLSEIHHLEINSLFGKKLTIVNVCENYIKLKGYRVWFLIDTFKKI